MLTYTEVMILNVQDLLSVASKHRSFDVRLRKGQIKLAVWRAFCIEAWRRNRLKQKQNKLQNGCGFVRCDPLDDGDSSFKQARVSWVESLGQAGKTSEQERKVLVELGQELTDLQNDLRQSSA